MNTEKKFKIIFKNGVVIEKSKRLRNYGALTYSLLVREVGGNVSQIKKVLHDDKSPSNQRQLTGLEMLELWQAVVERNPN